MDRKFIHDGPYEEVNRDKLPAVIQRIEEAIKLAANVFKKEY